MSDTKHTPGPWDVDEGDFSIYRLETGEQLAEMCGLPPVEAEANARLMASAPDMRDEITRLRAELAAERERRQFAEDGLKLFRDAKIQWRVRTEAAEAERDALRGLLREARVIFAEVTRALSWSEEGPRLVDAADMLARIDALLNKGGGDE